MTTAEQYVQLVQDFCLNTGIRRQLNAFRSKASLKKIFYILVYLSSYLIGGFSRVFSLENLYLFSAEELQSLLCGDQAPSWSREDLLRHTEPKNGYTRDSPGYLMFIDVAAAMNPDERKVTFICELTTITLCFISYRILFIL